MFGLPSFLMTPKQLERELQIREDQIKAEKEAFEKLAKKAVDWDPGFKYTGLNKAKKVCFKASTYVPPKPVFEAKPVYLTQENLRGTSDDDIRGPILPGWEGRETQWVYRNAVLPRGESLWVCFGNALGTIYFDDEVTFSILYEYKLYRTVEKKFTVWMSHTPMETFTQRAGIRHCSGHVCIGGHGLGWFLEQVAKKRSVKSIVVVEKSKELIDWFALDQVKRIAGETGKVIRIVHADVFEYLVKRHGEFDKIALDVFDSYGNNNAEDDPRLRKLLWKNSDRYIWAKEPAIDPKKVWVWGSAKIGRQERVRF